MAQAAAELYEAAGQPERAAELYIRARSLGSAAPLLRGVENAALRLSFALAKEGAHKGHRPAFLWPPHAGDADAVPLINCDGICRALQEELKANLLLSKVKQVFSHRVMPATRMWCG